jgi:hypothetical protein
MLSPNARNFVPCSSGIGAAGSVTVTVNVHPAERPPPSIAEHITVVVPAENELFEAAEQVITTGAVPPVAIGLAKVTCAVVTVGDAVTAFMLAGQAIDGGAAAGGAWQSVQAVGLLWHATEAARSRSGSARRVKRAASWQEGHRPVKRGGSIRGIYCGGWFGA